MESILVFGASGHAKVVADIVERQGRFTIAGFIDSFKEPGPSFFGYRVIGNETKVSGLVREHSLSGGILAIGDNWSRFQVVSRVTELMPAFLFVTAIHSSAQIGRDVTVGEGTVIMAGAVVNSGTRIGKHCILNTGCSIDHDSVMGDFSSLAPGVTAGGNVTLGDFSAISLGAHLIHGVTVGEHTVVGAGATVLKGIGPYSVAYGTPARIVRKRKKGEGYL